MNKRVLVLIIACLAIFGLPSLVSAQGAFKITPADYSVNITQLAPVELEYRLVNGLDTAVKFSVYTSEADAKKLADYHLELKFKGQDGENIIGAQGFDYNVAGSSTSVVTVQVLPKSDRLDYEINLPIILKQTGGSKKLDNPEYALNLKLKSNLDTLRKSQQLDILIVGGIAAVIIIAIAGLLFLNRKNQDSD